MTVDLRHADNRHVLPTLADGSVAAIVTEPCQANLFDLLDGAAS